MPFPFLPLGAIVAAVMLIAALTVFGLALRAMDRTATRTATVFRGSMLPWLVSGLRGWGPSDDPPLIAPRSDDSTTLTDDDAPVIVELMGQSTRDRRAEAVVPASGPRSWF